MSYKISSPNFLQYRPGVGLMIINKHHQIFVGRRIDLKRETWQMPQGGIELGETPSRAALREMEEEIGSKNATIIAESVNWYSYDIPTAMINKLWEGQYRGQTQKWFLIKFHGEDEDINLHFHEAEFSNWKWVDSNQLMRIIMPFKRKLYKLIISEFKKFILDKK